MRHRTLSLLNMALIISFIFFLATHPGPASGEEPESNGKEKVKPAFTVHQMPEVPGILFQAETVDAINIHLCGADGTVRPLTERSFAKRPSVSGNGRTVFYQDSEDFPLDAKEMTDADRQEAATNPIYLFQIYALDMKTGSRRRISDGGALDSIPVAAPAGLNKVAFCSRPPEVAARWDIFLMDHDGSRREPLDDVRDGSQLYPSWAPDGKQVVYVLARLVVDEVTHGPKPETDLMIRHREKGATRKLPTEGMLVDDPDWSPQGGWIAFTVYDMEKDNHALWRIRADGSGLEQLTQGPDHQQPSWLPDGRSLLFVQGPEDGLKEICVVNLESGKVSRVISASNASCERPQVYPSRQLPTWEPKRQ